MTDGTALYTHDGAALLALAVPTETYRILDGCKLVAKKCFYSFRGLAQVDVPDSIEALEPFAFAATAIASFTAPAALKSIGEKAFFNCSSLVEVTLNEGLTSIGENAFAATGLRRLRLPATIEEIGKAFATRTPVVFSGPDATFGIEEGSSFKVDTAGGLYREDSGERHLVRLLDETCTAYTGEPGTRVIDDDAFLNHAKITEVDLCPGLEVIGKAAFRGCRKLVRIGMVDSVRSVGADAFLDTNIAAFHIPADLDELGESALVTYGAHHGDVEPSLHEVTVAADNGRFYREPGLLLESKADGNARIVLCTGDVDVIRIPPEVDEIAPYAFNGVRGLNELYLSDRIDNVGLRGLAVSCLIDLIHVDLVEPIEGHAYFDLRYPHTDRSAQQMNIALSVPTFVSVAALIEQYDVSILNASGFDVRGGGGMDEYEQCTRILERLLDPVLLTSYNRSMADRILKSHIGDICVSLAKHDDRRAVDALCDLGYLNADNILAVIEKVGVVQDAAMTGYLLELKRMRFQQQDLFDFDL